MKADKATTWATQNQLAKRAGWFCVLCSQPIDPDARRPDPLSGSVDHIVPRSRGGGDEMSNLQLAHLRCNNIKNSDDTRNLIHGTIWAYRRHLRDGEVPCKKCKAVQAARLKAWRASRVRR